MRWAPRSVSSGTFSPPACRSIFPRPSHRNQAPNSRRGHARRARSSRSRIPPGRSCGSATVARPPAPTPWKSTITAARSRPIAATASTYLLDQLLNEGRRLTAVATDDAHFKNGDYGGFVEVKAESLDPDALLESLKTGRFYSSQSPRLLDVEVSPGEIAVSCTPVHSIALLTGTSRALSKIGRHVTSAAFDLASVARQAWANPSAPEWFRIVAIDAAGRRAWTNPIWIDKLAAG